MRVALALAAAWCAFDAPIAQAVVIGDGSPFASRNTSTTGLSAGELAVHALVGRFGGFLGTPIDASHFITAQHVGISLSDTISFPSGPNAGTFSIVSWVDDPGSDLRIVRISGSFPAWVSLNGWTNEINKTATIIGRGGDVASQVFVGPELKGWTTAAPDGQVSWGRNTVTGTLGSNQLYARFDVNGGPYEAGLSSGDSAGPWFISDSQGVFRLIGVSYSTTGPYQPDVAGAPNGVPFEAALFDIGGLWVGPVGNATFVQENPINVPAVIVASRIADRIGWISAQLDLPIQDTDHDGVTDQFDNCPFVSNANQLDTGGLGFTTTPDGIGNVCQCGDITGEGQANDTDASFIKRWALGLPAALFLVPGNCDVNADGKCSGVDATLIRQVAAGNPNPLFGQNCANAQP